MQAVRLWFVDLLASDDLEGPHQVAVFEVDQPIGKPVSLDEKNKSHLKKIKAFEK